MAIGLSISDPATITDDARFAEESGFDLIAVGEHLFHHGPVPNPFVQLAAAAAVTERVRLLSSVSLLPLYPAALLAKLATTLDIVSSGRLDLGLGAGGEYPAEFAAAGVDPSTRFRRLDEGLQILHSLFSGERVSFTGEFATLDDVGLEPAPRQPGGPPIWLGGRGSGSLRRAGRHAAVWMPYMVTPERLTRGVAQARETAVDAGRDPASLSAALFAFVAVDADANWARRTGITAVSRTYQQDFTSLADRYLLLGTPNAVTERIHEFTAAGAETIVLQVAAHDAVDRARIRDTLVADVLPEVGSR